MSRAKSGNMLYLKEIINLTRKFTSGCIKIVQVGILLLKDYLLCYHGTVKRDGKYIEENGVNLEEGRFNTDFGKGFYVTNNLKQAESWAKVRHKQFLKRLSTTDNRPVVVCFLLDIKKLLKLSGKQFEEVNLEWSDFIIECRYAGEKNYLAHEFDYVVGALADGKVIALLNRYIDGIVSNKEFFKGIYPYTNQSTQLSLHTIKAIECLNILEVKELEL